MKQLYYAIQICIVSILLNIVTISLLIRSGNKSIELRNNIDLDNTSYQYQIDSLKSIIDSSQYQSNQKSYDKIIDILIQIESGGDNNAHRVDEDAVGALQIRKTMVRDVNRILRRRGNDIRYEFKDRWCRYKSIEMFNIYRSHYDLQTPEEIARCWNGGPKGLYKPATIAYWNKVKTQLLEEDI